jgi:carboxylesterase
MTDLLPGAEPFSAPGGPVGALVLHGFTGSPQSVRPLARAFADAGYTVESPLLPGHGTSVDDMLTTGFDDWSARVEAAYLDLAERCERVVVSGLSMGGTLTLWLAAQYPEIAGIVPVNAPALVDPEVLDGIRSFVDAGAEVMDAVGGDVADPDAVDLGYDLTPLRPLLSLWEAIIELDLSSVTSPALVVVSAQDHVVDPASSHHVAASVSGPVEVLVLERSYHVATLDHDRDLIAERVLAFAAQVAGPTSR